MEKGKRKQENGKNGMGHGAWAHGWTNPEATTYNKLISNNVIK